MTGIVKDVLYGLHDPGPGHPECVERYEAALRGVASVAAEVELVEVEPCLATEDDVAMCHSREYIELVKRDVEGGASSLSTGDTELCECSFDAAMMAVGGVMAAADAVVEGRVNNAFCAVRPPGHHAMSSCGMGFCIFNNVAVAARHLQQNHGVDRVLIVDWDVHHGNGTQEIFYDDPSVFYFSTHQWPCYPGTGRASERGAGSGKEFTMNCPFPPGAGRAEIMGALREKLVPAMRDFRPEAVLISAGFDGRIGDIIGNFALSDEDFGELTEFMLEVGQMYAGGRVISVLEGGYTLVGLESAVGVHVGVMAG